MSRLDIALEVGSISEKDVTAQATLLDATTSSAGSIVESSSMQNLP